MHELTVYRPKRSCLIMTTEEQIYRNTDAQNFSQNNKPTQKDQYECSLNKKRKKKTAEQEERKRTRGGRKDREKVTKETGMHGCTHKSIAILFRHKVCLVMLALLSRSICLLFLACGRVGGFCLCLRTREREKGGRGGRGDEER